MSELAELYKAVSKMVNYFPTYSKDPIALRSIYFEKLSTANPILMIAAIERSFLVCKELPTIVELFSSIGVEFEKDLTSEEKSIKLADELIKAIREFGYTNKESFIEAVKKGEIDPLALKVVNARGGWHSFCNSSNSDNLETFLAQLRKSCSAVIKSQSNTDITINRDFDAIGIKENKLGLRSNNLNSLLQSHIQDSIGG